MEKYINAIMATITSFLTCIAPVAAMENFKHTFNCEGEAFGKPAELVGGFDHNNGSFALKDHYDGLKLYNDVEVTTYETRIGEQVDLNSSYGSHDEGHAVYFEDFFKGSNHNTVARVFKKGTRVDFELTCKTSCTACSKENFPSEYCKNYCGCPEGRVFCGQW